MVVKKRYIVTWLQLLLIVVPLVSFGWMFGIITSCPYNYHNFSHLLRTKLLQYNKYAKLKTCMTFSIYLSARKSFSAISAAGSGSE